MFRNDTGKFQQVQTEEKAWTDSTDNDLVYPYHQFWGIVVRGKMEYGTSDN